MSGKSFSILSCLLHVLNTFDNKVVISYTLTLYLKIMSKKDK